MPKKVNLVIVCEDILQETFVRAFLRRKNFTSHQLRFVRNFGAGDAKCFVCEKFCQELKDLRTSHRIAVGLIYVLDADNETVQNRQRQLDTACQTRGLILPDDSEPVFGVIPKWEIENWLEFLDIGRADEECNTYNKYRGREADIYPLVERLADKCTNRTLANPPPSLATACAVFAKFTEWKKKVLD